VKSPVRNLSGRIEPGAPIGELVVDGDLSNQAAATIAFDLGGTTAITQYDRISVGRSAFLAGTLEVSLAGAFTPVVGNAFTLLTAADNIVGEFDNLQLPGGFTWSVTYNTNNVVLAVTGIGGLTGDYNGDGTVDTRDYTIWRDTLGAVGANLPADGNNNGSIDPGDYNVWKNNFGQGAGSGLASSAAVPEPAALTLIALSMSFAVMARQRRPLVL
jgi:hypothetical protein